MKITLFDIKGFGKFNKLSIKPSDGFNIVFEDNEAGKSTLQAFIRAMFYGLRGGRKGKDGSLPPLRHYKPWNGDQYSGILEYRLDDGSGFRVGRNFEKGSTLIYDDGANDVTNDFPHAKDIGPKFAEEHLGLNEESFEHSVFIRQMQCAIDDNGRKALVEKLSNLATTGSEELSLTRAVEGLESALLEYVGTERSTTRPLDLVNARLSELEIIKNELIELNDKYLDTALELREKKELINKLSEKLEQKKSVRETVRLSSLKTKKAEYESLIKRSDTLRQQLDECLRQIEKNKSFENIDEGQISRASILIYDLKKTEEELSTVADTIKELQNKITQSEQSIDSEETFSRKTEHIESKLKEQEQVQQQEVTKSGRGKNNKKIAISTLIATALFIAMFFYSSLPVFIVLASVTAVISVILLFTGSDKNQNRRNSVAQELSQALKDSGFENLSQYISYKEGQAKEKSLLEHNRQKILENQQYSDKLKSKLESIDIELGEILKAAELVRTSDKNKAVETLKQGLETLKNTKAAQKVLLSELSSIENNCKTILREAATIIGKATANFEVLCNAIKELESKFSTDAQTNPDTPGENQGTLSENPFTSRGNPDNLSEINNIEEEITDLEERISSTNLQIAALKARLEQAPSEGELAKITEETELFMAKKLELEKTGSALKLAIQVLNETALEMQRDFIPALNREMSQIMGHLTFDRYSKVSANDKLQLNLEVPETYELIPVSRLSGGTIDQVYFSMRIAAIRLLEKGRETLPIFLDEPFAQYDENRTRKAFELLKEISGERQIFFFTCREREFELAKEVFGAEINRVRL